MDELFERIKATLATAFPGAIMAFEEPLGPRRATVIEITWEGFNEMSESERQDKIWDIIRENYNFMEYKRIAFILPYTNEEKIAYASTAE